MRTGRTAGWSTSRTEPGTAGSVPRVGRGLAAGDLDNDGRIDALILAQNEPLAYFHNQTKARRPFRDAPARGNEIQPRRRRCAGDGHGRRPAPGRPAQGGGSYQSANDPRLHFGLGKSDRVDRSRSAGRPGEVDRYGDMPADTGYVVREGEGKLLPLAGFGAGRGVTKGK